MQVDATTLVPGDIVALEAGDVVPADGRILRSATLETQEAALTGESAPIAKDAGTIADAETTLGDRANMVFQNTQVTRGTAIVVITDTGRVDQRIVELGDAIDDAQLSRLRDLLGQALEGKPLSAASIAPAVASISPIAPRRTPPAKPLRKPPACRATVA